MKVFITWLVMQGVFARILLGVAVMGHNPDWVVPVTIICCIEAIVSAVVVFPLMEREAKRS